tara:strand:- start:2520 stop:3332 length:813 start_codon:yes stop_codon:yes gene_type:complete
MKKLLRLFKRIITFINYLIQFFLYGTDSDLKQYSSIKYKNFKLLFINSNNILRYRINNFKTKEPETLEWIENFEKGSNFWDIGANIGSYSILASKINNCEVVSFEPSYANLNILSKNIYLNKLQNKICTFPLAVNEKTNIGMFKSSEVIAGHANSSFNNGLGFDGKPINVNFEYKTISMSLDDMIIKFNLKQPDYIKIDVDGNEHLVLSGAKETIKKTKEILIELPGDWKEQTDTSHKILKEAGFNIIKKHNYDSKKNAEVSANEIWKRL